MIGSGSFAGRPGPRARRPAKPPQHRHGDRDPASDHRPGRAPEARLPSDPVRCRTQYGVDHASGNPPGPGPGPWPAAGPGSDISKHTKLFLILVFLIIPRGIIRNHSNDSFKLIIPNYSFNYS